MGVFLGTRRSILPALLCDILDMFFFYFSCMVEIEFDNVYN